MTALKSDPGKKLIVGLTEEVSFEIGFESKAVI